MDQVHKSVMFKFRPFSKANNELVKTNTTNNFSILIIIAKKLASRLFWFNGNLTTQHFTTQPKSSE